MMMIEPTTWPEVGLAVVNMLQIVLLAWIAQEVVAARKFRKRHRDEREDEG
jgi:hypothetical protein